ncbi:MAG: DnaD domain protein [Clostridiales bacterium]|jgi:DNA replication protein DnaD|nr:DnaD domain protein [Clostridiales bacterium]
MIYVQAVNIGGVLYILKYGCKIFLKKQEFIMSLFGFSSDFIIDRVTTVDNMFINEYLPGAKDGNVKVYIYGLFLASHGNVNSVEELMRVLGMSYERVFEAFQDLELSGLIEIASQNPLEIRFTGPASRGSQAKKRYKPEKYAEFNKALQGLFHSRIILPNEFLEYYDFIEKNRAAPEALLMIAAHCINVKGDGVGFKYVLAVARDWARAGVTTPEKAEEKIKELELLTGDVKQVFSALGKKSPPEFSDREMLSKWNKTWGFSMSAVLLAAKRCKNKGGMAKLDAVLESYHKMNIHDPREIAEYAGRRDRLYSLAAEINKKIGVYYESLDNVIETYTVNWCEMGFDDDALMTLANYCFLKGLRRLSDMDALVVKFYKMGRLTTNGINQYIDGLIKDDEFIKKLYDALNIDKLIGRADRKFVSIWLGTWGFSEEIILSAAALAKDVTHPMERINQILSDYKQNGIFTPEKVKDYMKASENAELLLKKLYDLWELNQFVTQADRKNAGLWLGAWGFSEELILFAAEAARGKSYPAAYLNQILSDYKQNGIFTLEKAKEYSKTPKPSEQKKSAPRNFTQRKYSKEELNALFDDLDTAESEL